MLPTINQRLLTLRQSTGLTQFQFGKNVGLTQAAISQYESGDREPTLTAITKLAKFYEIPYATLLGEIEQPLPSGKDIAIAALNSKLKDDRISVKQINALTQLIDAQLKY